MDLKLEEKDLRAIVTAAVTAQLTPEKITALLSETVGKMMEPQGESWNRRPSILADAFEMAVRGHIQTVTRELFAPGTTYYAQLRDMVTVAWSKMVSEKLEDITARIGSNIFDFLTAERRG